MQKELIEKNPILKNAIDFSLMVISYCEILDAERRFIVSRQLLKCSTSIGANAMEARNAESKADFIHKMKIAAKEADEAQYWLILCDYASQYPECSKLQIKLQEIQRILNAILGTAKRKLINVPRILFLLFTLLKPVSLAHQHISSSAN